METKAKNRKGKSRGFNYKGLDCLGNLFLGLPVMVCTVV